MILTGKYNTATVYTDIVDDSAQEQIQAMCNNPVFADSRIRIMPDVHAGKGCTIGTTMTLTDKVVPNMVGVDIGCGMEVVKIAEKNINYEKLDEFIYSNIPSGFNIRCHAHKLAECVDLSQLRCFRSVGYDKALKSVGTLGGGNHFIEVDRSEQGELYLVVHSGSRHLGVEVAKLYQAEACRSLNGNSKEQIADIIQKLKSEGRTSEIQRTIEALKAARPNLDPAAAYCSGQLFNDYIHDMKIVQRFAKINRVTITEEILNGLGLEEVDRFTTIHNYIDTDNMILRKGAVSAQMGERLLIPINMRDGALICTGKGNEEWNFSAPHGAGRILSRNQARAQLTVEQFKEQMKGIYTTSVNAQTIDESPMAYKSIEDIVGNILPTVTIDERILPVYNYKAAEGVNTRSI